MATRFDWGKFAQDNKYAKKWGSITDISELTEAPVTMAKGSILNENKSLNQYMYGLREKAKEESAIKKLLAAEDESYRKISNYNPRARITKWNTGSSNTTPLNGKEKFSNQFLGVFGSIKNLKSPKKMYVIKGGNLDDPISGEEKEVVFESPMEIEVVAEDKNSYYARDETGSITAFQKKNTVPRAPDPEEQTKRYKESIIRNKKKTAGMMDKLMYNVSQGVQSVAFGSETQGFAPTGNKALDVASKYGGQILGFGTPTGAGGSLYGMASKVAEKGLLGTGEKLMAKGATKTASKLIAPGIAKTAMTGATDMALYSAAQENPSIEKTAGNIALGAVGGVAMHGLGKLGSKVLERFATKTGAQSESKIGEVISKYRADQKAVDKLEIDLKAKYGKVPMTKKAKLQADKKAVAKLEAQLKGIPEAEQLTKSIADQKAVDKLKTDLNTNFGTKVPTKIEKEKLLKEKLDKEVQDQIKWLKNTMSKGVQQGQLAMDKEGTVVSKTGRISNNEIWYQDFYKANGRKPYKNELEEIAVDQLTNGYGSTAGKIEKSDTVKKLENLGWKFKTEKIVDDLPVPNPNEGLAVPYAENIKSPDKLKIENPIPEVKQGEMDLQMFGSKNKNAPNTKISEYIVSNRDKKPLGNKIKEGWQGFYKQMVDKNNPLLKLEKTVKQVEGKSELLATESPHKLASLSGNYEGIAYNTIENGIFNKLGKKIPNSKSFKEIAKSIPKNKENEFAEYIVAKHAINWMEPAKKMGTDELSMEVKKVFPKDVTTTDLKAIVNHYETLNPAFEQTQKDLTRYSRQIMKTFLVDSGLIGKKDYLNIISNYPNYVPLQRLMGEAEKLVKGGGVSGKFVNVGQQVKKAIGSERKIMNPLESIIKNTYNYAKAMKNAEVGQSMLKQVLKHPDELKSLAEVVEKVDDATLQKALKAGDLDSVIEGISESFIPKTIGKSGANDVVIRLNGQAFKVRVHDPQYLEVLTNIGGVNSNKFIQASRAVTNKMKVLTTGVNPMFSLLRNIWRDIPTSYLFSKTSSAVPVYGQVRYLGELIGATIETFAKSSGFKDYQAIGGGFSSSVISAENLMKKSMAKYVDKGISKKVGKGLSKPLDLIMDLSNAIETGPRYREYKQTVKQLMKKGIGEVEAKQEGLYRGAEVTVNFRKHGDAVKAADAFVPYLNAAVQGIDKFTREMLKNPKNTALITVKGIQMLTLPAMFLYGLNKNDKNYHQLSTFIKDNNFCVPLGGSNFLKIPKPRELGVLFASFPERVMDLMERDNPEAFKGLVDSLAQNFLPPGINETIISSITRNRSEAGENWRGTPLIPQRLLDLPANLQYTDKTSRLAIKVAGALDFMGVKYSPMKIDDILGSYLGVITQLGIPATSGEVKNEKDLLNKMIDVLKRQATADSKYSTDIPDEFYTNMKKVTNDKAVAKLNGKLGAKETYMDRASYIFGQAAKSIAELRDQQRKAKTNEEKDKIQNKMIKIYTETNEDYKKFYTEKKHMGSIKRNRDFIRPGTKKKEYKWWEE